MTTTQNHDAINYCHECDAEYAGHRCARCPLCPLRIAVAEADNALRVVEPWRVIKADGNHEIQEILNEMSVSGWTQDSFHVSHQEDRDGVRPVYVAVMRRKVYDGESHALRRAAHQQAFDVYFSKQDEMAAEVKAFRAAHSWETS